MASLADLIRSQSAAAQRQGMSHQDSYSQMDPGMERYLAGQESATRGVPLEAPMLAPDDLIGSGLLKGLLNLQPVTWARAERTRTDRQQQTLTPH